MSKNIIKVLTITMITLLLAGCSLKQTNIKSELNKRLKVPKSYNSSKKIVMNDSWLLDLNNKELDSYVNKALNNNFQLKQYYYEVLIAKESLTSTDSSTFPSMDLSLNQSYTGDVESSSTSTSTAVKLSLDYEVDLWGKLSDSVKMAQLNILQTQATFSQEKQNLANKVVLAYYTIKESMLLKQIYLKHLNNAKRNFEITSSKYKQGLSTILEKNSSFNTLYNKKLQIKEIDVSIKQAKYNLENLLGEYPKGLVSVKEKLPLISSKINKGLPSSLLLRKASLNASWNKLLKQDSNLAFTHKQRLPSFSLSASFSKNTQDGTPLAWSLLGGITAPIFNAGKLKANEQIEYFELKKLELSYLDEVYTAFLDIENLIVQENSLQEQYRLLLKANKNLEISYTLSSQEYLNGLITYSTLLETQDSYFSSQINLIQMKKDIIDNRMNLHLALGGDFVKNIQVKESKQ